MGAVDRDDRGLMFVSSSAGGLDDAVFQLRAKVQRRSFVRRSARSTAV